VKEKRKKEREKRKRKKKILFSGPVIVIGCSLTYASGRAEQIHSQCPSSCVGTCILITHQHRPMIHRKTYIFPDAPQWWVVMGGAEVPMFVHLSY